MNEKPIIIKDFSGSLNTKQAQADMSISDSPDRANTRNYPIGKLTKRDGFTAVGSAFSGGSNAQVNSLFSYDDNTDKRLIGVYSDIIKEWNGTAWSNIDIEAIDIGEATTQFDITNPSGSTFRYTYDGTGTDPDLSRVIVSDEIVLAAQNFNAANNGTFTITGIGYNYFEVTNASGVAEANKTIGTGTITLNPKITEDAVMYMTSGYWKESSTPATSGTATGETDNTLTDSSATRVTNQDSGRYLFITEAGKEQFKKIISNTATSWNVDSDWSPALAGTETYEIYDLKPICYMCNGIEPAMKYNGTTLERVYSVPVGKYITFADSRLYIADGSALFYSSLVDTEDFTVDNLGGFLQSITGKNWTGIKGWSDKVYAFERNVTVGISRDADDNPSVDIIDQDIGCASHRSIVDSGNYLLFLSDSKATVNVYALAYTKGQISLVRPENVSKKITINNEGLGLEGINRANIDKTVAVYHEEMYKLFAPFVDETVNSEGRLLDFAQENTIPWNRDTGYKPASVCIHQDSNDTEPIMYYGGSDTAKVYKWAEGIYSDDSVAIDGYYFTPIIDLKRFGIKKYFRWLYLNLENIIGKVYVDIIIRNAQNKVTYTKTIRLYGGDIESGGWGMFSWGTRMWGGIAPIVLEYIDFIAKRESIRKKGYSIQFKIYNSVTDETFTLAGIECHYKPVGGFARINTNN